MQLTISAEAKKTQRNFHHAREIFPKDNACIDSTFKFGCLSKK
ncbi:hypothetical protein [Streptococcus constellatus]|uniref:Uncharacterized protein n=1 Tax=Streptococcus constellatus subsp. pharyngis SK1060 = CCUG 46377 TaxID=1035184 RepID=F9P7R1_STRCV|nr:hypothetical protein [Streptococcus constellatus]EGV08359.1 hypothetical protein HMPREF1042_1924 [Streptococcus constellatus subsp. pharyngis SK1060 = CCUG 46377]